MRRIIPNCLFAIVALSSTTVNSNLPDYQYHLNGSVQLPNAFAGSASLSIIGAVTKHQNEYPVVYSEVDLFNNIQLGELTDLTIPQVENWFYGMLPTIYFENGSASDYDEDVVLMRVVSDVPTLLLPSVQVADLSHVEILTVHLKSISELSSVAGSGLLGILSGLKCIRVVVEIPECYENPNCLDDLTVRLSNFFPTTKIGDAYVVYAIALAD